MVEIWILWKLRQYLKEPETSRSGILKLSVEAEETLVALVARIGIPKQSEVQLWIALDLPPEQLNNLSMSKCHASLIYLGPTHATIKFP